eukprot:TRINITY_DN60416_c0_g1_i1.p1 TRINITY_DN60416_c0_g1~~TRINITY_DN60416_c0_g1_i1.p1  ORF type:complete len:565 (+),score=124.82 TRINITY_DN60416_c0_g1_i1:25-1695(+)
MAAALRALPDNSQDHRIAPVVQVAVGKSHALLLTDEGVVYSWGSNNDFGQLGRVSMTKPKMMEPTPLLTGLKQEIIVQIACGMNHCLALTNKGALYSWGSNKAGQLGVEGFSTQTPLSELSEKAPKHVKRFTGTENGLAARSCSCGPESSACVTTKGEVYVWGAISYYLIGQYTGKYARGENCTVPVKIRGLPQDPKLADEWCPDQVSIYKDSFACSMSKLNIEDDMVDLISSLKTRSAALTTMKRLKTQEKEQKPSGADGIFALEELRHLNDEFLAAQKALKEQMEETDQQLHDLRSELAHCKRELTICDQQDSALTEAERSFEEQREEAGDSAVQRRALETKLHDISHFKSSNQRKRMQLLKSRDDTERELLRLTQELTLFTNQQRQLESRARMIRSFQGDQSSRAGNTGDEGLKMADSKRRELDATEPMKLAGVGRFMGLKEVISISDRSLHDVSSSLKEVRAAASNSGDASILEAVLEENLELRKAINALIEEKRSRAEFGSYGDKQEGRENEVVAKGLLQFFEEARGQQPGTSEPVRANEASSGLGMLGFG